MDTLKENQKRLLGFLILALLVAAVPLTVFITQKQQDIRQRASGNAVSIFYTMQGSTVPVTNLSLTPGQQVAVNIYLNAGSQNITSFNLTIAPGVPLRIVQFSEGDGAAKFNAPFLQNNDPQSNTYRFSKGSTNTTQIINGTLNLGTLTLRASETTATGTIQIPSATITALTVEGALPVHHPDLPYTITQQVPSITGGTTPSITQTATPGNVRLHVRLGLSGIPATANPIHIQRLLTVELYNNTGEKVVTKAGPIIFHTTNRKFEGSLDMGAVPTGSYTVKLQTEGYLRRFIPRIVNITTGTIQVPETTLIAGDINSDNVINLQDFNIWLGCFGKSTSHNVSGISCVHADLNDDGRIDAGADKSDFLVLLRSLQTREGE